MCGIGKRCLPIPRTVLLEVFFYNRIINSCKRIFQAAGTENQLCFGEFLNCSSVKVDTLIRRIICFYGEFIAVPIPFAVFY